MISLTALIFGRHHRVFEIADYVQIRQHYAGKAVIVVSISGDQRPSKHRLASLFDLAHVNISFDLEIREQPIRTKSGKTPLLIHA
jgi:phenylacetate-CoA ligase